MLRTRRRKATINARTRGIKRKSEEKDQKDTGMEGAASSQVDVPSMQENPTSRLTQVVRRTQSLCHTMPLPEEPDYSRMEFASNGNFNLCPKCSTLLKPAVVPAGRTTTLLHCARCSTTPLCERCLYPCSGSACTNQSCQVVSLLLTCDRVTDSASKVYGCPLFRACPKCHNVMMHQSGCKYVMCGQCTNIYCFICLRIKQVCVKGENLYFSLTCSAPRAARQRFQT